MKINSEQEKTLADKAYFQLRQEIIEGKFASSYPMLETEIAEQIGMSRTPVRTAIERLKNNGLLESISRKGVFVKPLTISDVDKAYEVYEGLEGALMQGIVARATDDEIQELCKCVADMQTSNDDDWIVADHEFHLKSRKYGHNLILVSALQLVDSVVNRVRFLGIMKKVNPPQLSTREHQDLTKALQNREANLACSIHQKHLRRIREAIIIYMQNTHFPQ